MSVNTFREDETQRSVPKRETLARLYRYLFAYKKKIAAVLLIMAVTVVIALVNPLLIERAINVHVARGDVRGLFRLGVLALALNVIWLMGVKVRMVLMEEISNEIVLKIREQLYVHIQSRDDADPGSDHGDRGHCDYAGQKPAPGHVRHRDDAGSAGGHVCGDDPGAWALDDGADEKFQYQRLFPRTFLRHPGGAEFLRGTGVGKNLRQDPGGP